MNKRRAMQRVVAGMALAVALANVPASAETYSETVVRSPALATERVPYDDLNLASARGREHLQFRLRQAARRVCGLPDLRIAGGVRAAARNQACYQRALEDALSQVNGDRVASVD